MELEVLSFDEFKKTLNEKKENQTYSSGCLMGYFNTGFKDPKINKEHLYDNDENEYGLEIEPHVTVLYGLTDDKINEEDIIKLFTLIDGPEVSTDKITLFENEKFDVVKWDIDSEELKLLNKMTTSMFPFKSDHPDYHAHVTIAYCLPGTGKEYIKEFKKPFKKKIDYWVYSKADGKKIKIVPGEKSEVIRETYPIKETFICDQKIDSKYFDPNRELDERELEIKKLMSSDESYNYKGYDVKLEKHKKFDNVYYCTVYLNDKYIGGLKGPSILLSAKEWAQSLIDNKIQKEEN
jgi:hypothetical protein